MATDTETLAALVGAWKLVSARIEFLGTSQMIDVHGPNPNGYAMFSANGRVMFLFMGADRQEPSTDKECVDLFKGMTAYGGRFTVEGKVLTTEVDVSWYPSWMGTMQSRFFELNGDTLVISTGIHGHPSQPGRKFTARVVWEREVS